MNDLQKFLKKNKKTLLIALAVIAVVLVVWIVVRRLRQSSGTQKSYVEDLTGQSVTAGLNFDQLAERMFNAWVSTLGTDEAEVYSILEQLNNQADWEYLQARYQAYWSTFPAYEQWIHGIFGLGLTGVLIADMRRELNKKELQRCRDILTGKNINPGF